MATRSYIVLKNGDMKVALYKHWDGYPAGIMEVVIRTIRYLQKYAWSLTPWWHDPEIVASFMIAQDWDYIKEDPILKDQEKYGWMKPDIRPASEISYYDVNYVYEIDISEKEDRTWTYWTIHIRTPCGVEIAIVKVKFHYRKLSEEMRYAFEVSVIDDPYIKHQYGKDIEEMVKYLKYLDGKVGKIEVVVKHVKPQFTS